MCNYYEKQTEIPEARDCGEVEEVRQKGYCMECGYALNNYKVGDTLCEDCEAN